MKYAGEFGTYMGFYPTTMRQIRQSNHLTNCALPSFVTKGAVKSNWGHSNVEPRCSIAAKRDAKRRARRIERRRPFEIDGIEPLNIIVKGETNLVARRKRDRATKIEIAPNVFDIRYIES